MFHCGVRRFAACPVFSQHTAGDKHKVRIYIYMNIHKIDFVDNVLCILLPYFHLQFERYFKSGAVAVATVFAPVSYPPQPVLVFKQQQQGE